MDNRDMKKVISNQI